VLVPCFFHNKAAFCGVFDGTVGDHASDFIAKNIVSTFCGQREIQDLEDGLFKPEQLQQQSQSQSQTSAVSSLTFSGASSDGNSQNVDPAEGKDKEPSSGATAAESSSAGNHKVGSNGTVALSDGLGEAPGKIRDALRNTFLDADAELIRYCAERGLHYASSTGVVVFLWENLLTVAHVGDSKACIAKKVGDQLFPEWLTVDHKPNMPHELERIERNGGSLVWLHGNKPFIRFVKTLSCTTVCVGLNVLLRGVRIYRGGDFVVRQAAGEHPKQLNYSRAFGGKDLKMYGLSSEPDISHFEITADDYLVMLASDGLWDVVNPRIACEIAVHAQANGRSASSEIVRMAIEQMPSVGVRDNITVIVIFLHTK
jgi:serine/threonine protein phosphatase PrpC